VDQDRFRKARCSAFQVSVSRVIIAADSPAAEPRNCPSAGTKSPLDRPYSYSSGGTSVIFGHLRPRWQDGRGEPLQLPVCGSVRSSLTRRTAISITPALVNTSRGW
jgi:hypothetical protein